MKNALVFVLAVASACAGTNFVSRDSALRRVTIPAVDQLIHERLPARVVDCGVFGMPHAIRRQQLFSRLPVRGATDPGSRVSSVPESPLSGQERKDGAWAGSECVADSIANRRPFLVRYPDVAFDILIEYALFGDGKDVFQIRMDSLGDFTLESCAVNRTRYNSWDSASCAGWLPVQDFGTPPNETAASPPN